MGNKKFKVATLLILDIVFILFASFIAVIFRFKYIDTSIAEIVDIFSLYNTKILGGIVIYIICFALCKQYRSIWTIASIEEFLSGVIASLLGCNIILLISVFDSNRIPLMVSLITGILVMIFCNGIRIGWRVIRRVLLNLEYSKKGDKKRVLVIGAGSAGSLVTNEFKRTPKFRKNVVAFVDDNPQKIGSYVAGIKVLGNRNDIPRIVSDSKIDEIIIAMASINKEELKNIINICNKTALPVKIMPGVTEMIDGKFSIKELREVNVEDLLGRESIKLDFEGISDYLENKVVIVTGGGGSIGSELCRQIARFNPKQLIIIDIYENNAYDIQNELKRKYPELNLVTLIASVRDRSRIEDIFNKYKPQVVFHAAAHKHVPLMESSPEEAIKNNVKGTLNVAEVANKFGVKRFVLISTDKAVNPTNVMGATKRLCEMIIQGLNKVSETEYVAVRFGNVLGSNGSVVPLFKKQILNGGPVTLTHEDITRYFMTIPEASQLVLQAGAYAKGGEIFILDMGEPVRIYDLAENLIRLSGYIPNKDIDIEITGLRPGEKLYEELLMNEEGLISTRNEKIFIGKPSDFDINKVKLQIDELMFIAKRGDETKLVNKLKEVVPTFKDPDEVNSEVAATVVD